jgi:hypothetical protein
LFVGVSRLAEGTLFSSHVALWDQLWASGRIEMLGNVSMALSTNAALYYLTSALPLQSDKKWPFFGMAPGGLAHGGKGKVGINVIDLIFVIVLLFFIIIVTVIIVMDIIIIIINIVVIVVIIIITIIVIAIIIIIIIIIIVIIIITICIVIDIIILFIIIIIIIIFFF